MEVIILLFRFSSCSYKREFFMFLLIIVFLAIKTFFSHFYFIGIGTSIFLVYVTGTYIHTVSPGRFTFLWTVCVGLVSMIIVILMFLQLTQTIYFSFFYLYIIGILFISPSRRLWRLYKDVHSKVFLYLLVISILFIFARSFDLVSMILNRFYIDMTLWISICLIAGIGFLIFQKGYLIDESLAGFKRRLGKRDKIVHSVFSRLIQTEDTLLLQDRLIASGLLSTGTSHEFKNILTHIKALSQSGLTHQGEEKKNDIFRAIHENTEYGINFIKEFFNMLALRVEEDSAPINMKKDLAFLFKLIRIECRKAGIMFHMDIDDNVLLFTGRGELEQVLLNLVRNSIDSLKESDLLEKKVMIKAYVPDEYVIVDVIDNGEGIPEHLRSTIFEPDFSLKQSTGLGLFLVKMLINKNRGNIENIRTELGTCFRLILPHFEYK